LVAFALSGGLFNQTVAYRDREVDGVINIAFSCTLHLVSHLFLHQQL
jgi:hypothetical protein